MIIEGLLSIGFWLSVITATSYALTGFSSLIAHLTGVRMSLPTKKRNTKKLQLVRNSLRSGTGKEIRSSLASS